jgi:Zn-finger nucleic acid-binding protein
MNDDHAPCPRCQTALHEVDLLGIPLDSCPDNCGLLVPMNQLVPLMTRFVDETHDDIDPDMQVQVVEDTHGTAACPDCAKPMTRFGYMESRIVTLDRCTACWQVWIDTDELEAMVRLYARTTGRADAQYEERQELNRRLSALVAICNSDRRSIPLTGDGGFTVW